MTIRDALKYYKDNFAKCWEDEKYKWVAVKHFQENWKIDAGNFAEMLEACTMRARWYVLLQK